MAVCSYKHLKEIVETAVEEDQATVEEEVMAATAEQVVMVPKMARVLVTALRRREAKAVGSRLMKYQYADLH